MGGKTTSTSSPRLNQIQVQSSALGLAIMQGWGRGRAKCNLGWYGAFKAIPQTTKSTAGKGLGGGSRNTTYSYTASIILMIGEGPIGGIRTVYRDKSVFTDGATTALAQANLSLATGEPDQAPWGYMVSQFPSEALSYPSIAYVYASDYDLGDTASLPNHSFEVDFALQLGGGACDADPADIATDYLTNASRGLPGWASGLLGDLSNWSDYARANGLLLSPVEESQRQAREFLLELGDASNTNLFWSEGLLKATPLGDAPASGNGVDWVPNLTPAYELTEDDFSVGEGDPPVIQEIVDQSDAYNLVQVEFLDRAQQYNAAIMPAQDLDNIIEFGRRKQDPTSWHSICDAAVADVAAKLLLARTLYVREQYRFRLPWDFVLLEPTDLLALTTTTDGLKLDRLLVRIEEIEEDEEGELAVLAKVVPLGTASAAAGTSDSSGEGYQPNRDVAPGSVDSPVLFNPPTSLTGGATEVWCAAASTSSNWGGCEVWVSADGDSYAIAGRIENPARYGVLTALLPTHADPDGVNVLAVDLANSLGDLTGGTDADMDAGATLALVGDELLSYRDADLTGPHAYSLSPLRRGLHGTAIAGHAIADRFVRLDDAIFKLPYTEMNVGTTMFVKLPSFNIFGRALEDLAEVEVFEIDLIPNIITPREPDAADWSLTLADDDTTLCLTGTPAAEITAALIGIQFEYRLAGDTDWNAAGLDGPETQLKSLTGLPAGDYEVAIRYLDTAGLSERLILGPETVVAIDLIIDGQI